MYLLQYPPVGSHLCSFLRFFFPLFLYLRYHADLCGIGDYEYDQACFI